MEHINNKEKKISREKYQLLMIIGIYLSIILLITAIIVLVKNIDEIKSDPISYGINKKDFVVCSCWDKKGTSYDYNSTGVIPKQIAGWNYNFE